MNLYRISFSWLWLVIPAMLMVACKTDPLSPGLEYMPDMYRATSYETYGVNPLFADSAAARQPVAGTVARNHWEVIPSYEPYAFPNTNEGYEAAGKSLTNPLPNTEEVLAEGKRVYGIFCIHCHGEKGDGNGILVERDKFAGVPSYYSAALKDLPQGKIYHSIYWGKNMMGSHASQINMHERWAVVRYVEKLRAEGLGESTSVSSQTASK